MKYTTIILQEKLSRMDITQFGSSKEIQKYLELVEKSIPKGSFVILPRNNNWYWYFNLSSGKNRLIYLCSIFKKGNEDNSFLHSVSILKKKLKNEHKRVKKSASIIDYIVGFRTEGDTNRRGVERTQKTIQDIISHIRKFRTYIETNPIDVDDLSREGFMDYFSGFISYLVDSGLKPNTIRDTIVHPRQFLVELSNPSIGKKIIPYHPISSNLNTM